MSEAGCSLQSGGRVTCILDLRSSEPGNGTLGGWVQKENWEKETLEPMTNLLNHLTSSSIGFVPAVETKGAAGFRLLSFQKLQD